MDILTTIDMYIATLQQNLLVFFLLAPLALIALDVATGILAAMKQGVFTLKQCLAFIQNNVVPYLAIVFVVFLLYVLFGSTNAINVGILLGMSAQALKMLGSISENLKELGVSAPVIAEVEQVVQPFYQGYPPVIRPQSQVPQPVYTPPAPVYMPPIEQQQTQVPMDVVRVSTPPPAPVAQPIPVAPAPVAPPVVETTMTFPTGL